MGWRKRKAQQRRASAVPAKPIEVHDIPQLDALEEMTVHADEAEEEERQTTVEVGTSTVGPYLRITGELSGDENLVVHGQVDGSVTLVGTDLTVGPSGRVRAEIRANSVLVEGEVVGDITAEGRVEVTATGSIQGDIRAGRVVLTEGARFRGRIDMGPPDDDRGFFQESTADEEPAEEAPQSSFLDAMPEVSKFD